MVPLAVMPMCESIDALLATEGTGTLLVVGHETSQGWKWESLLRNNRGLFSKAFYSKVWTVFCLWHDYVLRLQWQRARMMKVTPIPLPEQLRSGITLRSPLSAVSDSFGHENEVDISKSSEEKTSATGSKVAPRSMGSLFSPMEKAKKAHR